MAGDVHGDFDRLIDGLFGHGEYHLEEVGPTVAEVAYIKGGALYTPGLSGVHPPGEQATGFPSPLRTQPPLVRLA
jgi:hypothetical protein